jgi:hypothetical protein
MVHLQREVIMSTAKPEVNREKRTSFRCANRQVADLIASGDHSVGSREFPDAAQSLDAGPQIAVPFRLPLAEPGA